MSSFTITQELARVFRELKNRPDILEAEYKARQEIGEIPLYTPPTSDEEKTDDTSKSDETQPLNLPQQATGFERQHEQVLQRTDD